MSKKNANKPQEKQWVIESNLRDIISENKQKLIGEQTKRAKLEQEVDMYAEMLVKTKAEWANSEHEKEKYLFEFLKLEEQIEEYEVAYDELEKENEKLQKYSKKHN
jgi:hypothetical protein